MLFAAAKQFLATRRLLVPEDVSLISAEPGPNFLWQEPSVAHFGNDRGLWVNTISSHALGLAHPPRQGLPPQDSVQGRVHRQRDNGAGGWVAGAMASGGEELPSNSAVTRRGVGGV